MEVNENISTMVNTRFVVVHLEAVLDSRVIAVAHVVMELIVRDDDNAAVSVVGLLICWTLQVLHLFNVDALFDVEDPELGPNHLSRKLISSRVFTDR